MLDFTSFLVAEYETVTEEMITVIAKSYACWASRVWEGVQINGGYFNNKLYPKNMLVKESVHESCWESDIF